MTWSLGGRPVAPRVVVLAPAPVGRRRLEPTFVPRSTATPPDVLAAPPTPSGAPAEDARPPTHPRVVVCADAAGHAHLQAGRQIGGPDRRSA